jgi:hypothetical protein
MRRTRASNLRVASTPKADQLDEVLFVRRSYVLNGSGFWIPSFSFSARALRPGLLVEDVEQVGPFGRREERYRRHPARAGAGVAPVASRQRACRRRCFSGAWPTQMSEESQHGWSQFQTPRARCAAMSDWEGKLERFESILRLGLNSSKVRTHGSA